MLSRCFAFVTAGCCVAAPAAAAAGRTGEGAAPRRQAGLTEGTVCPVPLPCLLQILGRSSLLSRCFRARVWKVHLSIRMDPRALDEQRADQDMDETCPEADKLIDTVTSRDFSHGAARGMPARRCTGALLPSTSQF